MWGDEFRFTRGLRNANDRSKRIGLVVGVRVLCCDNIVFSGDFESVLGKHSKHFDLNTALAVGLEQMQRNFKPMADQIRYWRASLLTDGQAKEILYRPFIEDELDAPKHLACAIHHEYFEPDFRNLRRGPSGACKAPSPAASGSSNPFLNSRQQPALASTTIH